MRFSLSALVVVLGSSATIAQTAPAAKPVAGQSAPAAKPADPAKQAISKACSDQATAKEQATKGVPLQMQEERRQGGLS
jgi:hypothetical protein